MPTLDDGEPAYVKDEGELYVGTATDGNIKLTSKKEIAEINTQLADIAKGTVKLDSDINGTVWKTNQYVPVDYIRSQQAIKYAQAYQKIRKNQASKICCLGDSKHMVRTRHRQIKDRLIQRCVLTEHHIYKQEHLRHTLKHCPNF
jgi:hypothetical protein